MNQLLSKPIPVAKPTPIAQPIPQNVPVNESLNLIEKFIGNSNMLTQLAKQNNLTLPANQESGVLNNLQLLIAN